MYPIVRKEKLADKIYLMDVKAKRVAKACLPGQFVIVKMDEEGERIPLTICDYDREKETITIVFQTVGASTERMAQLNEGDSFMDFVGPLGCPSELCVEENLEETIALIVSNNKQLPFHLNEMFIKPNISVEELENKIKENSKYLEQLSNIG